jgi:hypothetical protein
MDQASEEDCSRLTVINNWRLYFKIVLLSDMLNPEGTKVDPIYLQFPTSSEPPSHSHHTSLLHWPIQGKPSERSCTYWKTFICSVANCDQQGNLRFRLGPWIVQPQQSINVWSYYHAQPDTLYATDSTNKWNIETRQNLKRKKGCYNMTTDSTTIIDCNSYPTSVRQHPDHLEVLYIQQPLDINNTEIIPCDFNQ